MGEISVKSFSCQSSKTIFQKITLVLFRFEPLFLQIHCAKINFFTKTEPIYMALYKHNANERCISKDNLHIYYNFLYYHQHHWSYESLHTLH